MYISYIMKTQTGTPKYIIQKYTALDFETGDNKKFGVSITQKSLQHSP